ncbi:hypothetical protein RB614_07505 [Phytohabitans sp. ZYX-F-186]|uniref:Uncharacterized protein n=1 Tax=Phytohabitans maris TaxID=3071409 RepID=A0ABU0ZDE3_9ACTN|nr:hypothetical protein [Phytohabitans sp. ZYX-F-186]MDQ7904367.1 hypothetical protein [Phytohabitans sp. ZYX-F-186]
MKQQKPGFCADLDMGAQAGQLESFPYASMGAGRRTARASVNITSEELAEIWTAHVM